jgi:hypothetical protein
MQLTGDAQRLAGDRPAAAALDPMVPGSVPSSRWPGVISGLGLGGFVDAIALHQIVPWHNMGAAALEVA